MFSPERYFARACAGRTAFYLHPAVLTELEPAIGCPSKVSPVSQRRRVVAAGIVRATIVTMKELPEPLVVLDGAGQQSKAVRPATARIAAIEKAPPRRSARPGDPVAQLFRSDDHPVVVRDERSQLMTKLLCRGEVNGVQRAKLRRAQDSRGIQDAIVDTNEIQPLQHAATSGNRLLACRQERAQHFGAREGAGYHRTSPPEIAAQRGRLRLPYGQLHDG